MRRADATISTEIIDKTPIAARFPSNLIRIIRYGTITYNYFAKTVSYFAIIFSYCARI